MTGTAVRGLFHPLFDHPPHPCHSSCSVSRCMKQYFASPVKNSVCGITIDPVHGSDIAAIADDVIVKGKSGEKVFYFLSWIKCDSKKNNIGTVLIFIRQFVQSGHFLTAGTAADKPEVQHNNFSLEIFQLVFVALQITCMKAADPAAGDKIWACCGLWRK